MTVSYDPQVDALSIRLSQHGGAYVESEEVAPGVVVDFDAGGRVIGIELLGVRQVLAEATSTPATKPGAATIAAARAAE